MALDDKNTRPAEPQSKPAGSPVTPPSARPMIRPLTANQNTQSTTASPIVTPSARPVSRPLTTPTQRATTAPEQPSAAPVKPSASVAPTARPTATPIRPVTPTARPASTAAASASRPISAVQAEQPATTAPRQTTASAPADFASRQRPASTASATAPVVEPTPAPAQPAAETPYVTPEPQTPRQAPAAAGFSSYTPKQDTSKTTQNPKPAQAEPIYKSQTAAKPETPSNSATKIGSGSQQNLSVAPSHKAEQWKNRHHLEVVSGVIVKVLPVEEHGKNMLAKLHYEFDTKDGGEYNGTYTKLVNKSIKPGSKIVVEYNRMRDTSKILEVKPTAAQAFMGIFKYILLGLVLAAALAGAIYFFVISPNLIFGILCIGAFALTLAAFVLFKVLAPVFAFKRLKEDPNAIEETAEVLSIEVHYDEGIGRNSFKVYKLRLRALSTGFETVGFSENKKYAIGDIATIRYNPRYPKKCIVPPPDDGILIIKAEETYWQG